MENFYEIDTHQASKFKLISKQETNQRTNDNGNKRLKTE